MDGGIIVTSPHCTKGVNTRVLMHANTTELKHSDGGSMDGENYIAQLTEEERAELLRRLAHESQLDSLRMQNHAREIIEAREPELGLDGCERLRWYMGVTDGMLDRKWIHFPTEESRDEGFRRATRAAMEYSLWAQLYPDGFRWGENKVEIGHCIDMDNSISYGWELDDLIGEGKPLLIYATEADAQRVADILKREGV